MSLPKDVASALTDGVVLCHLANYIRPRSVATIHVPSAAVVSIQIEHPRSVFLIELTQRVLFISAEINHGEMSPKCGQFFGRLPKDRSR